MKLSRTLPLLCALTVAIGLAVPAHAADVTFLPGLRIGLKALPGLAPARGFPGLESMNDSVKVLITELPVSAYTEVEAALKIDPAGKGPVKPEPLQIAAGKAFYTVENAKIGADSVRRYAMILPGAGFTGYVAVQIAESAADKFSDEAVKGMLASVEVRSEVPVNELLALMPFNVTELSNFKNVRMLATGAALLLGDAPAEAPSETAPFMILGTISGVPEKADDRARFAQQATAEIPGLRDAKLTMAEPVRIDGAPGFETRVEAISGKDSVPVTVVQWLRFGSGGGALRIIGSTPREQWGAAFPRFRAVRDGLQGK